MPNQTLGNVLHVYVYHIIKKRLRIIFQDNKQVCIMANIKMYCRKWMLSLYLHQGQLQQVPTTPPSLLQLCSQFKFLPHEGRKRFKLEMRLEF